MKTKKYKIDANKIKNLKDVILIIGYLDLHFTPDEETDYKRMKHLFKDEDEN